MGLYDLNINPRVSSTYATGGPVIDWAYFRKAYDNSDKQRAINWDNLRYIDNWLNNHGYNLPQRQAIIYNIYQESGGDPTAVSEDGRFAGLLQWDTEEGGRYNKIKDKSLDGQLQYIYDTTYGNLAFNGQNWMGKTKETTRTNQASFKNAKTAREAMRVFTNGYVRPNPEVRTNRMDNFQTYFPLEKQIPIMSPPAGDYQVTPNIVPEFKNPYIPVQSIDLNTKEGFDNPILLNRVDKNMNEYANGGTIHIKPENRGKFTAAAERAGKSVQGYASQILAHPENYSPTLRKRAQFAQNSAKWRACGGKLYPDGGPIDPPALSAWNYVDNNRQNRQRMKQGYMLPEAAFAYQQDVNAMTERANFDNDDYRTAVAVMGDPYASDEEKSYAQYVMGMTQEKANQMVRAANTGMNKLPQWYLQLGLNELDSGHSQKDRKEAMRRIRNSDLPKIAKKDLQRMYSSERNVLSDVVNSPEYAAAENIPGVGDVFSLLSGAVNLTSGNTGVGTLELAAMAPLVPGGVNAVDNLRNIIAQKKRLDDALQPRNMWRFLNIGVDPTGSIDYRIPAPEPMPRQAVDKVQPSRKSVARYGKSKYSGPKPTGNKKTAVEDVVELGSKPVEQSPEPKQVDNTAKINEDKKQKGKLKGFVTRPWKERSTFRKAFDINAGFGLGTTAIGYGIKGISNLNENASKNIEDIDLNTIPPDSTTMSRYREDFINDSLNVEEAYNTAIKLGYNKQLMDSTRKEALDELENMYGRYLNR